MAKVTNAQLHTIITTATTTTNNNFKAVKTALAGKVDVVNGKGLSTNDFTDALLTKLNALPTNAELVSGYAAKSDLPTALSDLTDDALASYSKAGSVSAVGTSDSIATAIGKLEKALDGKQASGSYSTVGHSHTTADITDFPTSVSAFTNDSGYQTASDVATAISNANKLDKSIVTVLPSTSDASATTIYMILKDPAGESGNVYDEFMLINGAFEKIGDTAVDLTGYATESWVGQQGYLTQHQSLSGKQDVIDSSHKLDADLVDDSTSTNKFVTAAQITAIGTISDKVEAQDVTDAINDIFGDMVITPWADININS